MDRGLCDAQPDAARGRERSLRRRGARRRRGPRHLGLGRRRRRRHDLPGDDHHEREDDGGEAADRDGNGNSDPIETTLEWGVRSLGKKVAVRAEGDLPTTAVADLFPAYDDDGGLLLVLTPR